MTTDLRDAVVEKLRLEMEWSGDWREWTPNELVDFMFSAIGIGPVHEMALTDRAKRHES